MPFEILLKDPLSAENLKELNSIDSGLTYGKSIESVSTKGKSIESVSTKVKMNEYYLTVSPLFLEGITRKLSVLQKDYKVLGCPKGLVCMLDHFKMTSIDMGWPEKTALGLARLSPMEENTTLHTSSKSKENTTLHTSSKSKSLFVDLSVGPLPLQQQQSPSKWSAGIYEFGDLSNGSERVGQKLMDLGSLEFSTQNNFKASLQKVVPETETWQWVGRSLCLTKIGDSSISICGILARTAGLFENKKRICSCTGKVIWEE